MLILMTVKLKLCKKKNIRKLGQKDKNRRKSYLLIFKILLNCLLRFTGQAVVKFSSNSEQTVNDHNYNRNHFDGFKVGTKRIGGTARLPLQPEFVAPANTFTIKKIKNNTNNHNINNRNNISNNNNNITNNNNNNNYETFLKTILSRSRRENQLAVRRWSFTPSISGRRTRSRPRWPRPRRIRRRKVSAEPSKDLRPSFSRQTPSSTTTTESGLTDTTLKS